MKKASTILIIFLIFTSCTVNRHTVGSGPIGSHPYQKQVFDKTKHVYAVYGLVSLNEPQLNIPKDGNYQFQASSNVLDGIISILTSGLITTRTEKIYIKK